MVELNREQGTDFILPKWAFSRRQETSVSCSYAERSPFYLERKMIKICSKCKRELDISNFYKKGWRNRQEYRSECKDCYREYGKSPIRKKYLSTPDRQRKKKIKDMVHNRVVSGAIIKMPCMACGDLSVEAHHPDYNKPFEIVWLCDKHHKEKHGQCRPTANLNQGKKGR